MLLYITAFKSLYGVSLKGFVFPQTKVFKSKALQNIINAYFTVKSSLFLNFSFA